MLRCLSICSGIGGADLAAEMTQKIEVVGQVELDDFCVSVLEYYWPQVKRIRDIKNVRGDEWGNIDICIAGIPCQPHSSAGKRKGSADKRNLWPDMRRILAAQCEAGRPYRWFVLENVSGLRHSEKGTFFKGVVQDIADMGYRVGWASYGACEVEAPHQRERIFIVAYYPGIGGGARRAEPAGQQGQTNAYSNGAEARAVAYTSNHGRPGRQHKQEPITKGRSTPDTWENGSIWNVADATSGGPEAQRVGAEQETAIRCGTPGLADIDSAGLSQWDSATGKRSSQPATQRPGERLSQSKMVRGVYGFPDWLARHRWPSGKGKAQEEWEPPRVIQGRMKGRVRQIKGLGNAIVPWQLYPLLREIVRVEEAQADH